jgi:hypothetical protein
MKSIKKLFQYYLPVTLTLFMTVTIKRAVIPDGGVEDRLYGLPFPYITNNVSCTGCYEVYVGALLLDLVVYSFAVFLIFKAAEKVGLLLKTHWLGITAGVVISMWWVGLFYLTTIDSFFLLKNDYPVKIVHSELSFQQFL